MISFLTMMDKVKALKELLEPLGYDIYFSHKQYKMWAHKDGKEYFTLKGDISSEGFRQFMDVLRIEHA